MYYIDKVKFELNILLHTYIRTMDTTMFGVLSARERAYIMFHIIIVSRLSGGEMKIKWDETTSVQTIIKCFQDRYGDKSYLLYKDGDSTPFPPNRLIKDIVTSPLTNFRLIEVKSSVDIKDYYTIGGSVDRRMTNLDYVTSFIDTYPCEMFSYIFKCDIREKDKSLNEVFFLWNRYPVDGYHWTALRKFNIDKNQMIYYFTKEDIQQLELLNTPVLVASYKMELRIRHNKRHHRMELYDPRSNTNKYFYFFNKIDDCEKCFSGMRVTERCFTCEQNWRHTFYCPEKVGLVKLND